MGFVCLVLASAPERAIPSTEPGSERAVSDFMRFAAQMAASGNWREALFRWEQALRLEPDHPRILNNLAAAHEALGDLDRALELYRKALDRSNGDAVIRENASRARDFWNRTRSRNGSAQKGESDEPEVSAPSRDRGGRHGGVLRVEVRIPLPPRLDLGGIRTVLVASFRTEDTDLLDANREIVRFLRAEFRKHTSLLVLDVSPPPAVPEQDIEQMAANRAFWSRLAKEHAADLVVSGVVHYARQDASGFQDVDVISPLTGQKVRRTRFVEQERFLFEVEVLFFGSNGELRFRDRFQRGAVYQGKGNDPVTAFYDLSGTIAGDVLSVVAPRTQVDPRWIFKRL
jgi:hypothetical protein